WMREWRVRDSLDVGRVENPQIPLPLLEQIQRVMFRADVGWRGLAARRAIEHAAQPDPVHDVALHAKPHDATRAVVHHDEYPIGPQDRGLAAEQVETPETVLRVTEHREPRRPSGVWLRFVPRRENAAHDIRVDGNVEGQRDPLRDSGAPPRRIPPVSCRRWRPPCRGSVPADPASAVAWARTAGDISASSELDE